MQRSWKPAPRRSAPSSRSSTRQISELSVGTPERQDLLADFSHVHIEVPIPAVLTPYVERYCAVHRPMLLGTTTSNRLWISRFGTPLTEKTIYYHVTNRTKEAFGHPISPHLFRDCAATSVAIEDPDHVRIAANILGHHSLATTQRYYDQSRMLAASRSYQSALGEIRKTARQQSRGPYKSAQRSSITETC